MSRLKKTPASGSSQVLHYKQTQRFWQTGFYILQLVFGLLLNAGDIELIQKVGHAASISAWPRPLQSARPDTQAPLQ